MQVHGTGAVAPPIWEREEVLGAIERALASAAAGQGGTLFIIGEAGLGKTTMLRRAKAMAEQMEFRVGLGRGDEAESMLPFGVLDQALAVLAEPENAIDPDGARIGAADARAARFYKVLRSLKRSSMQSALLLLLDDLHWADSDSLDLLSFLSRRIGGLPVLVIAALRPWPPLALQSAYRSVETRDAELLEVAPLSREAAQELLRQRSATGLAAEALDQATALCDGNPLLLEVLALELRDGRTVAEIVHEYSGKREAAVLLDRFAGVRGSTFQFAQAASLFAFGFRPELAAEIAGIGPDEADHALGALWRAGLLRANGSNRVEFTHPLFRQFVYDQIPQPVRSRWHGVAFRALRSRAADISERADQAMRSDLAGDREAVDVLQTAGDVAWHDGGVSTARDRYQAAVDLAGSGASPKLLLSLAETHVQSGERKDAAGISRRVLLMPELNRDDRMRARRLLGRTLFVDNDPLAEGELRAAAEEAVQSNLPQAVDALLEAVFVAWPTGGPARAMPLAARAREQARSSAPRIRRRAETAWAFCALLQGDPRGIDVIATAAREAEANPMSDLSDFAWSWGTLGTFGNMAKWIERFDDAERAYMAGMRTAEAISLPVAMASLCIMHADTCIRTGRLNQALKLADEATSLAELAPERAFWAAIAHGYVFLEMGRFAEARLWVDKARSLSSNQEDWPGLVWLWHAAALLELVAGRAQQACVTFERIEALCHRLEIVEPCVVPWAGDAIAAYAAAERLDDAARVLEHLEAAAAPLPCRAPRIVAALVRAAGLARKGEPRAAASCFDQALSLCEGLRMPLLEARVRLRYGETLRRAGLDRKARPMLDRALALAADAGAGWIAGRAQEELMLAGGSLHRRDESLDELTASERRVAALVAEGWSNRRVAEQLDVSVNTIETHLQHVFQKLGISSRRELMLMAHRGDLKVS